MIGEPRRIGVVWKKWGESRRIIGVRVANEGSRRRGKREGERKECGLYRGVGCAEGVEERSEGRGRVGNRGNRGVGRVGEGEVIEGVVRCSVRDEEFGEQDVVEE